MLIVFVIVLGSVIVNIPLGIYIYMVIIDRIFDQDAPLAYFMWPPFAFYRALSLVNVASFNPNEIPYTVSRITVGNEVFTAMVFLTAEIFVFLAIAAYLNMVLPSEFGTKKPWHFVFTESWRRKKNTNKVSAFDRFATIV